MSINASDYKWEIYCYNSEEDKNNIKRDTNQHQSKNDATAATQNISSASSTGELSVLQKKGRKPRITSKSNNEMWYYCRLPILLALLLLLLLSAIMAFTIIFTIRQRQPNSVIIINEAVDNEDPVLIMSSISSIVIPSTSSPTITPLVETCACYPITRNNDSIIAPWVNGEEEASNSTSDIYNIDGIDYKCLEEDEEVQSNMILTICAFPQHYQIPNNTNSDTPTDHNGMSEKAEANATAITNAGVVLLDSTSTLASITNDDNVQTESSISGVTYVTSSVATNTSAPTSQPSSQPSSPSLDIINNTQTGTTTTNLSIPIETSGSKTTCGPTDNRVPSTDVRIGRFGGCTSWLVSENVVVYSGHCGEALSSSRIHFTFQAAKVAGDTTPTPVPVEDVYAVNVSTFRYDNNGRNSDWAVVRALPNIVTGKLPGVAQKEKCLDPNFLVIYGQDCPSVNSTNPGWFTIGSVPTSTGAVGTPIQIRITGYGTPDYRPQRTSVNDLVQNTTSSLEYIASTRVSFDRLLVLLLYF